MTNGPVIARLILAAGQLYRASPTMFSNRSRYRPDASLQIFLEHVPKHLTDSVHSRKYRIT